MAKIIKGLSDADMLKGYKERESFENTVYQEQDGSSSRPKKAAAKPKGLLLPGEEVERLNRFLLEISMDCLKKQQPCSFKVTKEGATVVIKTVSEK